MAARARYFNNAFTVSGGITVNVVPNAEVTLYDAGTTNPLVDTIYSSLAGVGTLPNPFFTDELGNIEFYLTTPKRIRIVVTGVGMDELIADHEPVMPDPSELFLNPSTVPVDIEVSSTTPALTLRSTHATGKALEIRNFDDDIILHHQRVLDPLGGVNYMDVFSLRENAKINYDYPNNGMLFDNRVIQFIRSDDQPTTVMTFWQYENNYLSVTADVETMGIYAKQVTGDSYIRPLELAMIDISGGSWPKRGMEISIQTNQTGNGKDYSAGISIFNFGSVFGLVSAKRVDSAILIGNDRQGFTNAIYYRDIDTLLDGNAPLLWKIDQFGQSVGAGLRPLTDGSYSVGSSSLKYAAMYSALFYAENGSATAPSHGFRTDTTSGAYLFGLQQLGWSINTAHKMLLNANELRLENVLHGKQTSSPASAAPGYNGILPKDDEHWYTIDASGVTRQIMDSYIIDVPDRLINGQAIIAQRAVMPTADNSWAIDGMRILMESASSWTISQETSDVPSGGGPYAFKFTVGATNNAKGGGFWPIVFPNMADMRGGKASAQLKIKVNNARVGDIRAGFIQRTSGTVDTFADPVSAWGTAGTNPTLTDGWAFINTPVNLNPTTNWSNALKIEDQSISSSANAIGLLIWCDDKTTDVGDYMLIADLKIEKNKMCTAIHPKSRSAVQNDCEFFLQAFGGSQYAIECFGSTESTTDANAGPLTKRVMRVVPTMSVTASQWAFFTPGENVLSALSIFAGYATRSGMWVRATSSSMTANLPGFLANKTSGTGQLLLSAEP